MDLLSSVTLITPPGEHELLVFWTQIVVLLVAARGLGQLMRLVGQPSVIGELGAGLVLGPSVFGRMAPGAFDWLFPPDPVQSAMLFTVGWMGVALLLVMTGFETDLTLIRTLGRAAFFVAIGSLAVPFAFGIATGGIMPTLFIGEGSERVIFALFMGTALSISSLPVIAKVLTELELLRRNFGQVTLAAGMANDIVGWTTLGIIVGLAQSGTISIPDIGATLFGVTVFFILAFTVGQRLVDVVLRTLRRVAAGVTGWVTAGLAIAFLTGVVTQALGVEAVLGAFIAGILLGRSRFRQLEFERHIESITMGVFAPIFFATAGLRVDLGLLGDPTVLWWAAVVLVVASISKFGGSIAGARWAGLSLREGAALGAGLNARGALEIVIATVGLSIGVLNSASYTVVVLMAMVTSMMAPPALRAIVRNWKGTPEEQERLDREKLLSQNVLVKPGRILLPSRGGRSSMAAARLAHAAWPEESPVTVLSVGDDSSERPSNVDAVASVFEGRIVERETVKKKGASEALRGQSMLGYSVLAVGADPGRPDALVSPLIDELLIASPIPILVVRQAQGVRPAPPGRYRRILVPVTGSRFSRAALEVALHAARTSGAMVIPVHVMARSGGAEFENEEHERRFLAGLTVRPMASDRQRTARVNRILAHATSMAQDVGVRARPLIREGASAADEILDAAREFEVDLIVMGANLRAAHGNPFLGHNVERVLERSETAVAVTALPETDANGV